MKTAAIGHEQLKRLVALNSYNELAEARKFIQGCFKTAKAIDATNHGLNLQSSLNVSNIVFLNTEKPNRFECEPSYDGSFTEKIRKCRLALQQEHRIRTTNTYVRLSGTSITRRCPSFQFLPQLLSMVGANISNESILAEILTGCFLLNWLHPFDGSNGKTSRLLTQFYPAGRKYQTNILNFFSLRVELWLVALPIGLYENDFTALQKILNKTCG